jgi:hypothetical protein
MRKWLVVLLLLVAPWIVGIVYYWRRRPRDGWIPPSIADMARNRLWREG